MVAFKSLKDLVRHVNGQIADTMRHEVAEKVRDVEQEQIEETVYRGYQPSTPNREPFRHVRRRDNGGLRDRDNMIADVQITSKGVHLSIENVTTGAQDDFMIADLVEYGDGTNGKEYSYKRNREGTADQYLRGRPFTRNTAEELQTTGEHVSALKDGMRKRGIDVR